MNLNLEFQSIKLEYWIYIYLKQQSNTLNKLFLVICKSLRISLNVKCFIFFDNKNNY